MLTFGGLDRAIDSIVERFGGLNQSGPEYTHAERARRGPVLYLSNPNNPTGAWHEFIPTDSLVVVDEAYIEFAEKPSAVRFVKDFPNLFVLRSFSKAFAMADYRLGYVVGQRVGELNRNPKDVSGFAQRAGINALENVEWMRAHVKRVREIGTWFCSELEKHGIGYYPSETNFVLLKKRYDIKGLREKIGLSRVTIGTQKQMELLLEDLCK